MNYLQLIPVADRDSSEDEMIIVDTTSTVDKQRTAVKTTSEKEKKRKSRGERNKEKDERNKKQAPVFMFFILINLILIIFQNCFWFTSICKRTRLSIGLFSVSA